MKTKFPVLTVFLYLLVSILYISCGNENKESISKSDSIITDLSETLENKDTVNVINHDKLEAKNDLTDSIPKVKIKNEIDSSSLKPEKKDKVQLIAYYFHATARCPSCINIENFTEEVINTSFAKENKEGLISFRQLNIEDSVNEHYINDYKLEFSSVILTKYVNGRQVKWKNLEHVWKFSSEKENFFKYMKIEIKDFLKEKEKLNEY
jgi:hypothetical protein